MSNFKNILLVWNFYKCWSIWINMVNVSILRGWKRIWKNKTKRKVGDVHLGHKTISSSALLILEDNVGIVVGHQIPKPGIVSRHATFAEPTSRKGVFTDIGHMLLKNKGREFAKGWPATSTPAGTAGQDKIIPRTRYPEDDEHQHNSQVTRKLQPRATHLVQVRRPCYQDTIAHHNHGPRGTAVAALCATLRVVDDDAATSFFFLQSRSVDHLLLLPLTSLTPNHNQGITPLRTLTSRTRNLH